MKSRVFISRRSLFIMLLTALTIFAVESFSQERMPRTFLLNPDVILGVRNSIRDGDKDYQSALKRLVRDAEKALKQPPVSVLEKKQIPPSGDKHDYVSLAPYWWPDPKKPDGLPYIRRDGEVNPERNEYKDKQHLMTLTSCVRTLSLAYYYTGTESYAAHAAAMLRTWFLNPETRMNPNLNYGQAVRGRNEGRGAGLIEPSRFRYIIDAIGLLESSQSWTENDGQELRKWFRQYFLWLRTSKNGIDESNAKNNHGTWYDVQSVSIALFLGDTNTAASILREAKAKRVAVQIEPDGRMPLEVVRTKALGYSTMNLEAFFCLASLGDRVGVDLWHYVTEDGRSLKRALDWLVPFYSREEKWTYKQIVEFDYEYVYGMLMRAAVVYGDERYQTVADDIPNDQEEAQRAIIVYGSKKLRTN
jgi:hypothetical protein